jgi:predicted flap endonuclease-1-like 5' DNA nuclease
MGLLDRLKSALGMGVSNSAGTDATDGPTPDDDVVRVERDIDTASEDAVKGTDTATTTVDDDTDGDTADAASELESIKGIGPTYARRLADAGISGVDGLADADVAELAAETDISEKRLQNWVDQAANQ